MPTTARREDTFIGLFVSAYENCSWADAINEQPDQIERTRPAVDWLAKRQSDGKTLAIEHTIIEPFIGEKRDFASFEAAFLEIERDTSLPVPGRWIRVFVPVGTLQNQAKASQDAIVESVHKWIKSNRLALRDGGSKYLCGITGVPGRASFDITLNIKVVPLQHGPAAETGLLHVRRQQLEDNVTAVIERALSKKLTKLVNTAADKRILLLERQHMNLSPESILNAIENRRPSFPDLASVDEIWIVETIGYGTAFFGTHLHFERYENGAVVRSFDFNEGKLMPY
jgi:hypothetical protein